MADANAKPRPQAARPLSPHLQIYRPHINMVMSIVHRITGAALYVGTILVAWVLAAAASGPDYFDYVTGLLGTWPGLFVLFGYSWALLHHLVGGLRHFIWDTGHGFELKAIDLLSWGSLAVSVALTLAVWGYVLLSAGGGFLMTMRTPLKDVRRLGSAKEGADHFWLQRTTGAANALLAVFAIGLAVCLAGADHAAVAATLKHPLVALPLILFLASAAIHMRIGMQVVIEDYVHAEGAKIVLLVLNTFFAIAVAAAGILSILKISFGG